MIRTTEGSWFDSRQTEHIFLFSKPFRLSVGPTLCPIDCVPEARRATDETNHSTAYGVKKKWRHNFITPRPHMNLWRLLGQLYLYVPLSVQRCEWGNKPFLVRAYCKSGSRSAVARRLLRLSARTAVGWRARGKVMAAHSLSWVNKTL
jgi:hypothetical protein